MANRQDLPLKNSFDTKQVSKELEGMEDFLTPEGDDLPVPKKKASEIATNDGSVIETLDTAFHGKPGWSEGENISGSNRADYYEARSNGKSDAEEELDSLRKRKKNQ